MAHSRPPTAQSSGASGSGDGDDDPRPPASDHLDGVEYLLKSGEHVLAGPAREKPVAQAEAPYEDPARPMGHEAQVDDEEPAART